MWGTSWMGLVLINSDLSVPQGDIINDRFIGRLELPWHSIGDDPFAGPGWFGIEDPDRGCTRSYGGNSTLARDLFLARPGPEAGTSFLVVGAYDPSGRNEDLESMAAGLRRSIAENFWPAMVARGGGAPQRLLASIRTYKGEQQLSEQIVDPADFVAPMAETLRKHYEDDVVETLDSEGDVIRLRVPLHVPARIGDGGHGPAEHEAVVLVAHAEDSGDGAEETLNHVVCLRGNNMIIRDFKLTPVPLGARPFHAIVLAGEAGGSEVEDRQAEHFLRAAEPPAHNRWTSTPEVTSRYARGAKARLDEFEREIKEAVRSAIRRGSTDADDGPESLKRLLRLVAPPSETAKRPRVKKVDAELNNAGAWRVEAVVSVPSNTGPWRFAPMLVFGTVSGPTIPVSWENLETVEKCTLDGRYLTTSKGARNVRFRGVTDPATHPVAAGRARVQLDLREVRVEA